MSTKLVLVGVLSWLDQGSLMQAVVGLTAALCFLLLHMAAQPFHQNGDDYLGTSTSFSICVRCSPSSCSSLVFCGRRCPTT